MAAEVKMFEVRDEGTTMPVIAMKPDPSNETERWLWAKGGYGIEEPGQREYVLLAPLHAGIGLLVCDPYNHTGAPGTRTLFEAHKYIIEHWTYLQSGDVIDVQYVLGESAVAKRSERHGE